MDQVVTLMAQYGIAVIFIVVLIERAGLPIPSFPILVLVAAETTHTHYSPLQILLTGLIASLAGDLAWYWAGQRSGFRILRTLCRISVSPDSCVQQTQSLFTRWGPVSLIISKFVPGFSAMAAPLAGAVRQPLGTFLLYDLLGSLLWCGSAIAFGVIFHEAAEDMLKVIMHFGGMGLLIIAGLLAFYVLVKWIQRERFIRILRMDRITVDELHKLMEQGAAPLILDARPKEHQDRDGMIPGALAYVAQDVEAFALSLSSSQEVVVYCNCPNEASAAIIAKQLMKLGAKRVRPLLGGMDAWTARQGSPTPLATPR